MKPIYLVAGITLVLISANQNFAGLFPRAKKAPAENNIAVIVPKAHYQVVLNLYALTADTVSDANLSALKDLLSEHLSIIKKNRQLTLDAEQESILVEETPGEIQQIIATEGYFNSTIKIMPTVTASGRGYEINVGVDKSVTVTDKIVILSGAIEQDPDLAKFYSDIGESWQLPAAARFRQQLWTASKNSALAAVQKEKYPLARIKNSLAQIDPKSHSALLTLEIESGEPIYFGQLEIIGAKKYPAAVIENLAKFKEGDVYKAALLYDYQNELEQDGHYSEAVVVPRLKKIKEQKVPVIVSVKEQRKQSVGVELTYDSDEGYGSAVDYQYYNLFKRGYVGAVNLNYNKYEQEISLGISQPRRSRRGFFTSRVNYYKGAKNGLDTRLWSTGIWYVYTAAMVETRLGLESYQEDLRRKTTGEKLGNNKLLLLTWQGKINRIETVLRPQRGYYFTAKIGVTPGTAGGSVTARRYELEGDYYFTPRDYRFGTLLLRAQAGYIATADARKIPDELKFKLGGPNSVRGYATDKIGMEQDGYTLGGLAKVAATVEYQKPLTGRISLAVFHDLGDVKDKFKDMKLKHGSGLGLRWYSMAAPLSFDVAYGHENKKVSWYLSLGTRF